MEYIFFIFFFFHSYFHSNTLRFGSLTNSTQLSSLHVQVHELGISTRLFTLRGKGSDRFLKSVVDLASHFLGQTLHNIIHKSQGIVVRKLFVLPLLQDICALRFHCMVSLPCG